jgi:hypothetical protein
MDAAFSKFSDHRLLKAGILTAVLIRKWEAGMLIGRLSLSGLADYRIKSKIMKK